MLNVWWCWTLIFTPAYMIYTMLIDLLTAWLYESNDGMCLFSIFPHTVKLTFVLGHVPSPFHFVTLKTAV